MARIVPVTDLNKIEKTLIKISQKNAAMGADSPIKNLLAEQNIVLAKDIAAMSAAIVLHNDGDMLSKQSENFTEMRNNAAKPAMKRCAAFAQILKTFYKPAFTNVGFWSIDITASGKISYPTDAAGRVEMIKGIRDKHASYPAGGSPLQAYLTSEEIDLDALVTALENAQQHDSDFAEAAAASENKIEQRNNLVKPVLKNLQTITGFLTKFYNNNPRELGKWDIEVVETPNKHRERKTTIRAMEKATIAAVVIGAVLTNLGETGIQIFKGKTKKGEPILVLPGKTLDIPKGYSTLTIVNPSDMKPATIKVLRAK